MKNSVKKLSCLIVTTLFVVSTSISDARLPMGWAPVGPNNWKRSNLICLFNLAVETLPCARIDDEIRERFLSKGYVAIDANGWPLLLKLAKSEPEEFEKILTFTEQVYEKADWNDPVVKFVQKAFKSLKETVDGEAGSAYRDPDVDKSLFVVAAEAGHPEWINRILNLDFRVHADDLVYLAYLDLKDSIVVILNNEKQKKRGIPKEDSQIGKEVRSWDSLHWAAYRGNQELCELLVEHGWDPTLKQGSSSAKGWEKFTMNKPSEVAEKRKFKQLAKWLREQEKVTKSR